MNLKFVTLLFLVLTFSCKSQNDLEKETNYISQNEESQSIIKLLENNRFIYSNKEKLADQASEGNWKKDGNKIFLISDDSYKSGVIESHEYEKKSSKTEIVIFSIDDNFLTDAGVTINDDDSVGWNVDENGIVSFPKKEITKITIHYLGEKYYHVIKNLDANRFVLKIRIEDLSFKYFDNELFILEDNELTSEDGRVFKMDKPN